MSHPGTTEPGAVAAVDVLEIRSAPLAMVEGVEIGGGYGSPPDPTGGARPEIALTITGESIPPDPDGVDPEGLAALSDGSFWVAEEYAPSLLRVGSDGRLLERIGPATSPRRLPPSLLARRPNQGLEALTLLPDGHTLVTIVQGTLEAAESAGRGSVTRVILFDTAGGGSREILYPLDAPDTSVSAACALPTGELLVVEHDGRAPGGRDGPAWCKRIYRVGIPDLEGPAPARAADDQGPPASLEKELLLDLLTLDYPHDKPEGIALQGDRTLLVVNDDDFGVTADAEGRLGVKRLPGLEGRDRNRLWRIRLEQALC